MKFRGNHIYLSVVCNFIDTKLGLYRLYLIGFYFLLWGCKTKHPLLSDTCASIRNENFVFFTYDDGTGRLGVNKLSTFVRRTDTVVTYTIQPFDVVHKYKIEWINPCEYKLTPFGPLSVVDSLSQRFTPYTHKIIKIDKTYILEYSSTMIDTLWIDK